MIQKNKRKNKMKKCKHEFIETGNPIDGYIWKCIICKKTK